MFATAAAAGSAAARPPTPPCCRGPQLQHLQVVLGPIGGQRPRNTQRPSTPSNLPRSPQGWAET